MGSMVFLSVGGLEIDWGKNRGFTDHSALYQPSDLKEIPYYYVDLDTDEDIIEYKDGLSKPLNEVIDRIELLGHTSEACKSEFHYLSRLNDFNTELFSFENLQKSISELDIKNISKRYDDEHDFGKFFRREIFPKLNIEKHANDPHHAQFNACYAMENLSSYTILHLLRNNPIARTLTVDWGFADIEYGGWVTREEMICGPQANDKFLIITEGSSDAKIIKHALHLLKPHLLDFFDFIDMEEGYPFTGSGNLVKFIKGLTSFSVQNNIIVIFDNDAEGVYGYNSCKNLNSRDNISILKLPDLDEFNCFKTLGPSGEHFLDINGLAVAIECFLDIEKDACIRWSEYKYSMDAYQGSLVSKDKYKLEFLRQKTIKENYDYKKILLVIENIIHECVKMKEREVLKSFESLPY